MIRSLNLADLKQVNSILEEFNYSLDEEKLSNDFIRVLVYEDIKIIGVLVYDLIYDRIEVEYIKVIEEYRKKGIASKLLKYLFKKDIKNITLEVRQDNKVAIEFYKKNGFNIIGIRKNYYKDVDGLLMIKEVGD